MVKEKKYSHAKLICLEEQERAPLRSITYADDDLSALPVHSYLTLSRRFLLEVTPTVLFMSSQFLRIFNSYSQCCNAIENVCVSELWHEILSIQGNREHTWATHFVKH